LWVDHWSPERIDEIPPPGARGVVCQKHSESLSAPRGWSFEDRREAIPRLFKTRDRGNLSAVPEPTTETVRPKADSTGSVKRDVTGATKRDITGSAKRPRPAQWAEMNKRPKPDNWDTMNRNQRKHWKIKNRFKELEGVAGILPNLWGSRETDHLLKLAGTHHHRPGKPL
jgi:hypothetical protein